MIRNDSAPIPATAGIGLRLPHHSWVLENAPAAGWFEVHAENYMTTAAAADELDSIAHDYPLSLHCVGLSLGAVDGPDGNHLARLVELTQRFQPAFVSDHLAWSSFGGVHFPDLLPLPYSPECLDTVSRNVERVQKALGRPILVENPSRYCEVEYSGQTEPQFLAELVRTTGCGILLDINNIYVTARNNAQDPEEQLGGYLSVLQPRCIEEIHLAGHRSETFEGGVKMCIDDHGAEVATNVWQLFAIAVQRLGPRPTLIEWDNNLPPFATLQGEAALADELLRKTGPACFR